MAGECSDAACTNELPDGPSEGRRGPQLAEPESPVLVVRQVGHLSGEGTGTPQPSAFG